MMSFTTLTAGIIAGVMTGDLMKGMDTGLLLISFHFL